MKILIGQLISQENLDDFMSSLDGLRNNYVKYVSGESEVLVVPVCSLLMHYFDERIKLKRNEPTIDSYEAKQLRVMCCRYIFAPVDYSVRNDGSDEFCVDIDRVDSYRNVVRDWLIMNFFDLDVPLLPAAVQESIFGCVNEIESLAYNQESTYEARSKLYRAIVALLPDTETNHG